MRQVIKITEEYHGTIAVASDFMKAKQYLLDSGWVTEYFDGYDEKEGQFVPLKELFGENWQEEFLKQDKDWFDGLFYFYEIDFAE